MSCSALAQLTSASSLPDGPPSLQRTFQVATWHSLAANSAILPLKIILIMMLTSRHNLVIIHAIPGQTGLATSWLAKAGVG
jgi:hypothetical protein